MAGVDKKIEEKLVQIESLDQFARTSDIALLFSCDTCIVCRRRLMKYIDSAYTIPFIKSLSEQPNLTYRSFGNSHFSFILILRHVLNNHSNDTTINHFWEAFAYRLVKEFIITPTYYANLTDYCFNFRIDENKQKVPYNNYGEFNFRGKIQVDNPEKIDQRRMEIGLLPLWESVSTKSALPENYLLWLDGQTKQSK